MMTVSFLAVEVIADCLPLLHAILAKNPYRSVSFILPIALAVFLSAILRRLLPLCTLRLNSIPPLILLSGASLSQEVNCLAF